ncbi:MAG: PspA/IM30 family protein [Chloroflexi bacterium]|nr:PspA/IM30 family protein [Chloroflexota bacterium]
MGLWSRFRTIFGAKVNRALDRMENPVETLDYSYEKQLALLRDVKRGLADIATSKQRLKLQAEKLQQQDGKLHSQAQQALVQGREDLARLALQRRQGIQPQLQSLATQIAQLDDQQTKLAQASQTLQTRIEMFRTQKETIKAQYTASSAQVKIGESFTGLSREMNDIGTAVQRAQDRIEQMQARSGALDELINSGALEDYTAQLGGGDDIDRQLRLTDGDDIDAQIAAMKAHLGSGPSQPQLESHE